MAPEDIEVLTGGNVAAEVVRIGSTVRKPWTPASAAVDAFLRHLEDVGFTGAPRTFGRDEQGRHVVEYVPGALADTLPPLSLPDLRRVGRLVRDLHEAASGFEPPPNARWDVLLPAPTEELVCHHDLAPWNLVMSGERWVFIDWDGAGPGSRLWDLAYAVHGFVPLAAGGEPGVDAIRMRALVDGYGLDAAQRTTLPSLVGRHTRAMFDLLKESARTGEHPWARLHAEGHADHWGPAADYIERHLATWEAALA